MKKDEFFKNQSHLTSAKIKIFEEYIKGYLPKLLMTFETCIIADLFCGPGKNGKNSGSPLILINTINDLLHSKHFSNKKLKIYILFNDQNKENIDNLEKELVKTKYNKNILSVTTKNENYEDYIEKFIKRLENNKTPKFIFLDPFTYSNVKMEDLKKLINLPHTEVLLFIPIFHSYRFASTRFEKRHKTRKFIEEFTSKGIYNYDNIIEFMLSVREQLITKLSLEFVRPVLLDGGGSKNSLFLLTKHQKGMLLMNKVVFKNSDDGIRLSIDNLYQDLLFKPEEVSTFVDKFKNCIVEKLKQKNLSNKQIVDYTIQKGLLPKHSKKILIELYSNGKIKVFDEFENEITNKTKWNIAEKINTKIIFKWL
ncbi:MAG: three-Cys-motif partner protein TcmP [Flavobacteriaceae bacterium]